MKYIIKAKKSFFWILYNLIFIHLPSSGNPYFGRISKKLRYFACSRIFKKCGTNVNVERGAKFGNGFNIDIGDNSGIGINCEIPNDTIIGKNVMMGPNVYILGIHTHVTDDIDIPIMFQGMKTKGPVIIEDNVWIGRQVLINFEINIKTGSIIAAGSVVTKNVDSFTIVGGNPAKMIKKRT